MQKRRLRRMSQRKLLKVDWIGWIGWSLGGVKYRAAYAAIKYQMTENTNVQRFPMQQLSYEGTYASP